MARIDWVLIRDAFVTGADDYGVLAKRFGVSRQSVELKASPKNEHSQLLRQQHRESCQNQTPVHPVVETETKTKLLTAPPSSVVSGASLSFTDVDALVDGAIARLYSQIQLTESRSLEKSAEGFAQLIDLKLKLKPPTAESWALLALEFGLPSEELVNQLKRVCSDE